MVIGMIEQKLSLQTILEEFYPIIFRHKVTFKAITINSLKRHSGMRIS